MHKLAAACVLLFAASPALADPETTLLLRDGSTFAGHVLRMEQGRRVVLRLDEDGTVRIVSWEQIEDITGVGASGLPHVDEWEPPARPLPQPGWVPLTIESDGASVNVGPSLSSSVFTRSHMQTMCATPCTYYVLPARRARCEDPSGELELLHIRHVAVDDRRAAHARERDLHAEAG
jgi:hypothetical protein